MIVDCRLMIERILKIKNKKFVEITGESQRTLINWVEKKLIVPLIDADGAGSRREYGGKNLREARLIRTLYDLGFKRTKIKDIMDMTRGNILSEMQIKLSGNATLNIEITT